MALGFQWHTCLSVCVVISLLIHFPFITYALSFSYSKKMAQYLLNVLNYPENPFVTYYEFSIECSTHFSVPFLQNLLQV